MTPTSLHAAAFSLRSNAIIKGEAGSSSLFEFALEVSLSRCCFIFASNLSYRHLPSSQPSF